MIVQDLQKALLMARKEKSDTVEIFSTLYAQVKMIGKNANNRDTTDEEAIAFLLKTKKANCETRELAVKINRTDIVENMDKQNDIINAFLPQLLSDEELKDIINDYMQTLDVINNKSVGLIMAYLKKNYGGRYEGKNASSIVKQLCNK